MPVERLALWTLLAAVALASCDADDQQADPKTDAGQAGGPALGGAGSAGVAVGGSGAGGSVSTTGGMADAAGQGGAAAEALGELSFSVWSVVETEPVPGHAPTTGVLERVELPPWFTLVANVPAGTKSVAFELDGEARIDDTPPFLLHEDAYGRARWQPTLGEHALSAAAFAETGAQGKLLAHAALLVDYRETGLAGDFTPLDESDNAAWVAANLDAALEPLELDAADGDTLPYRRFVPPDYDPAVKYPLFVFLHDRDGRGADNGVETYASALFQGPRSLVSPNLRHEFPAIVLVPQCPAEPAHHEWARWYGATEQEPSGGLVFETGYYPSHEEPSRAAELVRELVEHTLAELSIDPQRVYIAGESMGGTGTWDITWRWPELWAAAVPIAGYTDPSRAPGVLELPYWVFHSTADTQENVIGSLNMVDKLKVMCGSVRYTQYTDATHAQTFARVWNSEALLFPWIWSQRRLLP